tara:strand:- start:4036 stop:5040 length:1005 start_codon:yes stop_codon:yes gene_type:complete
MSFNKIISDIETRNYKPIYMLHGDEPYYIDRITDKLEKTVLDEAEKEFNQVIYYGNDIDFDQLIEAAKRFPMMAEHQLVIVKEAQNLKKFEKFLDYAKNPMPSTILVFAHKYKSIDKRTAVSKAITKNGVVFESKKLYENQIPDWINKYLAAKNFNITPKASMLLVEFLGNELSNIANELDKLMLNIPEGTTVNDQHVQDNIGINKDFNFFELQNALVNHHIDKAHQIAHYFAQSQKEHPLVVTLSMLNSFFAKVLAYHFTKPKDRTRDRLAQILKVNPFFVKDYQQAAKIYNGKKVVRNIGYLREYDLKSKGVNNSSSDDGALLKELIPKLMH